VNAVLQCDPCPFVPQYKMSPQKQGGDTPFNSSDFTLLSVFFKGEHVNYKRAMLPLGKRQTLFCNC